MSRYHHGNLREALMTRAADVIAKGGIEALSLRGLARDLGVSPTAPARHFDGRIDLLRALAKQGYHEATAAVLSATASTPPARLNAMAHAFVAWSVDNPALFATIMHPDVARHADEALIAALQSFANALRAAIADAQAAGWHAGMEREVLLHYAISTIRGLTINLSDPQVVLTAGTPSPAQVSEIVNLMFPSQ